MPHDADFDMLLGRQRRALGRPLKSTEILRKELRRMVGGRLYSECVRRIALPNRYRDDVWVDGEWRFAESFDGTIAWYQDRNDPIPKKSTARALASQRWSGTKLDYMRPLDDLPRLGCTLRDCGLVPTARDEPLPAVQIATNDPFAETLFIDDAGRIAAYHMDLPEAGEEEQELELCVDEWGRHDGIVLPVRSTVIDRDTRETVVEVIVSAVRLEPFREDVFNLTAA